MIAITQVINSMPIFRNYAHNLYVYDLHVMAHFAVFLNNMLALIICHMQTHFDTTAADNFWKRFGKNAMYIITAFLLHTGITFWTHRHGVGGCFYVCFRYKECETQPHELSTMRMRANNLGLVYLYEIVIMAVVYKHIWDDPSLLITFSRSILNTFIITVCLHWSCWELQI